MSISLATMALTSQPAISSESVQSVQIELPGTTHALSPAANQWIIGSLRSRPVEVDFSSLESKLRSAAETDSAIRVSLFPDVLLDIVTVDLVEHSVDEAVLPMTSIRSFTWYGRILSSEGIETGFGSMTVSKANALNLKNGLTATFYHQGSEYRIIPVEEVVHAVLEVSSHRSLGSSDDTVSVAQRVPAESNGVEASSSHEPSVTIDVLAVFTQAADLAVPDIVNAIDHEIGQANEANGRSGVVGITWRLVSVREVKYVEPASIRDALTDVLFMRHVQLWREQTGADQVVMFVRRDFVESNCGVATRLDGPNSPANFSSFGASAYSVVDVRFECIGDYNTAHEMGHNLSLRHEWGNSTADYSPFTYNHGYRNDPAGWRTVMSYSGPNCANPCKRIPNWSNPNVSFEGRPTGVPEGQPWPAENYRVLLNVAPYAASWTAFPSGPFAGAPYWVKWNIAQDLILRPDETGAYILDGWGGINQGGSAPAPSCPCQYWPAWNIARALDMVSETTSGVTLDGYGGLQTWGAPNIDKTGNPYWTWDIARGVTLAQVIVGSNLFKYGGATLDGWGGIHKWGGAIFNSTGSNYWQGWDIARDLALKNDATGGYTLDAWGGIHGWGLASSVSGNSYYPGSDWFTGMTLNQAEDGGYVIDKFGGIYPFNIGT